VKQSFNVEITPVVVRKVAALSLAKTIDMRILGAFGRDIPSIDYPAIIEGNFSLHSALKVKTSM